MPLPTWNDLSRYFYIDRRSLRLFRILIGLVIIHDLLIRVSDITAFYTEDGVLPLKALYAQGWNKHYWSLLTFSTQEVYLYIFFTAAFAAALMLIVGIQTRLMTFLCWVFIVSLQNRNPLVYQGGDDLLRMLLLWSLFLPLGCVSKKESRVESIQVNNVATAAILCQVLLVLFFSAIYKGGLEWWYQGSAIYYAVSLDQIARPVGLWLSHHYTLSVLLTRAVFLLELLILPVFLLPFFREQIRTLVVVALILFNIGILLVMMIGIFPLAFLASSALFIPTTLWNKIEMSGKFSFLYLNRKISVRKREPGFYADVALQSVIGFLLLLVLIWNAGSIRHLGIRFPNALAPLAFTLRLNQSWGMFAPTVFKEDGWIVARARLKDGTMVDINAADKKLSYAKPAYVLDKYKNDRWRKYIEQLYMGNNSAVRQYYAQYLIDTWNKNIDDEHKKVDVLSIIFMRELSRLGNVPAEIDQIILYETNNGEVKNTPAVEATRVSVTKGIRK